MRTRGTIVVLVSLFVLSLLIRKLGFGLASVALDIITALLAVTILFSKEIFRTLLAKLFIIAALIGAVCILQYTLESKYIIVPSMISIFIFMLLSFKYVIHKPSGLLVFVPVFLIYFLSVALNPRQFHNLFRAISFEDYTLNKYRQDQGLSADFIINLYKVVDSKKSNEYLARALKEDSLKNTDDALEYYSKSIAADPDNYIAYHRRGYLKLSQPNIDWSNASSSLKDFSRAIRLNPNYADAYFHRALAYAILGNKGRAIVDRQKVLQLDSALSDSAFQVKYGISKKSFSIPPDS
jgi:tetratricopeptide (TPR) repeat protein